MSLPLKEFAIRPRGQTHRHPRQFGLIERMEPRLLLAANASGVATPSLLPPQHVVAVPDSYAGIDLSWDAIPGAYGYEVQRAPAGSNAFQDISWNIINGAADVDVTAYHAYTYRVIAESDFGEVLSAPSKSVSAVAPLNPPLDLAVTPIGTSVEKLTWGANDDPPVRVEISRSVDQVHWKAIATLAAGKFDYFDKGLHDNTDYFYSVRFVSGKDISGTVTADGTTAIAAPFNLWATAAYSNQINLSWMNASTSGDSVTIWRSDDGGMTYNQIGFAPVGATKFSDNSNLEPKQTYKYYVAQAYTPPPPIDSPVGAIPDTSLSDPSNIIKVTTPAASISNLTATTISTGEIDLSWDVDLQNAFKIQVFECSDGQKYLPINSKLSGHTTSYRVTGLSPSTAYWFAVRAFSSATTPAAITSVQSQTFCPAPTNLRATLVGTKGIDLSWTNNSGPNTFFEIARSGRNDLTFAPSTSYQDTFDYPGETIQYQVFAFAGAYFSAGSNPVTVTETLLLPGYADPSFSPTPAPPGVDLSKFETIDNDRAILPLANGKILVAAQQAGSQDAMLIRYNANGLADTSFGTGGVALVNVGGNAQFDALAIAPNGDIVAGGSGNENGVTVFAIARFLPNGKPDSTFGTGGLALTTFGDPASQICTAIAVQPNGDIVAVGSTTTRIAVARYLPTGALDRSFATSGKKLLDPGGGTLSATGLTLQSNGKIVIGGSNFSLVRLLTNGAVDPQFGTAGTARIKFPDDPGSADCMTVDPKGNILLAGVTDSLSAIARFTPNGVLDRTFGISGTIVVSDDWTFSNGGDNGLFYGPITNLALQQDGGIIVTVDASSGTFFLARLVKGVQDANFGNGGATILQSNLQLESSLALDSQGRILVGEPALQRYNP